MSLTIAYITCRQNSRFEEWFLPSLCRQVEGEKPRIIKIDRYADEPRTLEMEGFEVMIQPPKPSVWSGPHRKTQEDWFDVANARNTALCMIRTDHVLFMDDLTVLMPGFFDAVLKACLLDNVITIGAYQKVRALIVDGGVPVSYEQPASGFDNRIQIMNEESGPCKGDWLYGYCCGPLEAFLSVDGYPEMLCGGLGFEDVIMGIVMGNAGWNFRFDKRMFAIESEEAHFEERAARRESFSKGPSDKDDKAWRALGIARQSKTFDNGFGDGGIRELRRRILEGEPFPIKGIPEHDWFTERLLCEL